MEFARQPIYTTACILPCMRLRVRVFVCVIACMCAILCDFSMRERELTSKYETVRSFCERQLTHRQDGNYSQQHKYLHLPGVTVWQAKEVIAYK